MLVCSELVGYIFLIFICLFMRITADMESVDFEVFGNVQGVFFRKYTQNKAKELNLKGWVRNARSGTVVGTMQGAAANVTEMRHWLREVGSPHSRIERCDFKNSKKLDHAEYPDFSIRH